MAKGPVPRTDDEVREMLLDRRDVTPDGCWEFAGARHRDGYGKVKHRREVWPAHRLAYALFAGPIPQGQWVLHSCDNPPCFNPEHLFLGASVDNVADMDSKGRRRSNAGGERNGRAKITGEQALAIYCDQRPNAVIARDFGLTATNVGYIKSGKTWANVTGHALGSASS